MKILCAAAASTLENICGFAQFPSLMRGAPRLRNPRPRRARHPENGSMLDVITLAIGLGFFALSIIYGLACDRL
jgi:hypothetical protein